MDDLDVFLRDKYRSYAADIENLRGLLKETLNVFAEQFRDSQWPYRLETGQEPKNDDHYTFSTPSMIMTSLQIARGRPRFSPVVPGKRVERFLDWDSLTELADQIDSHTKAALQKLVDESKQIWPEKPGEKPEERPGRDGNATGKESGIPAGSAMRPLTTSRTFGPDDPFTLTWLLQLLSIDDFGKEHRDFETQVKDRATLVADLVVSNADPLKNALEIKDIEKVGHAFPVTRVIHLIELLRQWDKTTNWDVGLARVHDRMLQRINQHLAQSSIPGSAFDPAELVFALEGLLLTSRVKPDMSLVDRVFNVLHETHERRPFWFPVRPFKVTPQGLVLLPASVEVANSLLRVCASGHFEQEHDRDYFGKSLELLEKYRQWLGGREYQGFTTGGMRFRGWESEHTYTGDQIHLWETSQVIIFFQYYGIMLGQHLARRSLELSRLTRLRNSKVASKVPTQQPTTDAQHSSDRMSSEHEQTDHPQRSQHEIGGSWWQINEPLSDAAEESDYRVFGWIDKDYVRTRRLRSMLLYGPPGTGKSTIAEKLSSDLKMDMLTITPSDFLAEGGEAIEARAKAIFDVLGQQSDMVVLFDEIDQLLLDRDSDFYERQGDIFKLLTPGMLTKINNLAKAKRVFFVIATNYCERIDRAIRRPGRIDRRLLILPPNNEQRWRYFTSRWAALKAKPQTGVQKPDTIDLSDTGKKRFWEVTALCTYREIGDLADRLWQRYDDENPPTDNEAACLEEARRQPALLTLESYRVRLPQRDGRPDANSADPGLLGEFALVAYLYLKAGHSITAVRDWAREALRSAADNREAVTDEAVRSYLKTEVNKIEPPGITG